MPVCRVVTEYRAEMCFVGIGRCQILYLSWGFDVLRFESNRVSRSEFHARQYVIQPFLQNTQRLPISLKCEVSNGGYNVSPCVSHGLMVMLRGWRRWLLRSHSNTPALLHM